MKILEIRSLKSKIKDLSVKDFSYEEVITVVNLKTELQKIEEKVNEFSKELIQTNKIVFTEDNNIDILATGEALLSDDKTDEKEILKVGKEAINKFLMADAKKGAEEFKLNTTLTKELVTKINKNANLTLLDMEALLSIQNKAQEVIEKSK